jgi:hypothetical protein
VDGVQSEKPIMAPNQSRAKVLLKLRHGTKCKIVVGNLSDQSPVYGRFGQLYQM